MTLNPFLYLYLLKKLSFFDKIIYHKLSFDYFPINLAFIYYLILIYSRYY